MASQRTARPRKASTAASHPPAGLTTGAPSVEASAASTGGAGMSSMPPPSYSSTGPTTPADCESLAAQLLDPSVAPRRKLEIASDLRDSAETTRDFAFYEKYLGILIPALITILGDEKTITFSRDSPDQRIRHTLLSYVQRLPHSEPFRQHENAVMELMIKLLKIENEENALLCIKVMIDGFRNHKEQAEPHVEPFLELVKTMYANTKSVVEKEFGAPGVPPAAAPAPTPANAKPVSVGAPTPSPVAATPASEASQPAAPPQASSSTHIPLPRALHSAKVLTECPIAVVLIFQTYKTVMNTAMLDFYPLVMESIKIQPEPQRLAHEEAEAKGETFVGVASGITNRDMYAELIKAQVKTMAFLAYVLRGQQQTNIKEYMEVFPQACVRLLRDCPPEDVGTRKELLVATRHILTSDSRASFIPYIDTLLEERVLVGTGISSREALRPLAYSVVADLIHHVRNDLPIRQLARVVYVFSCSLNDATFSNSIQLMCAKLLNTITESVYAKGDTVEATRIARSMFYSSLEKLTAIVDAHDRLKAVSLRDKGKGKAKEEDVQNGEDVVMEDAATDEALDKQTHGWRDIEQAMPVHAVAFANESLESFWKEARYLLKTLLHTFRSLLTYTRQGENPSPQPDGELLGKFFEYSLRCLAVFEGHRDPREPKEVIELLSQILLLFEPHVFSEVWTNHMDFFLEQSLANPQVFPVLQMLITHESVSHQLVGILLRYLMSHLEEVGSFDKTRASLTLRLFKMSFLAINTYIATNEVVLVPHLQKLIMKSFTFAAKAQDPMIYYQILRALFRSIGGGRFEALYKEVLPILQEMLDTLAYLLQHATDDVQRDLFVELTLTVPVRLTNLLPHLSYLMKPLVHALQAGPDLISQGLRTLELCIDNLTAEFLDPTMGPVLRELMTALHHLLKPIPATRSHASNAVKILGKLGGRNRRFQEVENMLEYHNPAHNVSASLSIEEKSHELSLNPIVVSALAALRSDAVDYRDDAMQTLFITALSMLQEDSPTPESNPTFAHTMNGLFLACDRPEIGEKALQFVRDFCKRAFALELSRVEPSKTDTRYTPESGRNRRQFPLTTALEESFVETLASSSLDQRDGLRKVLATVIKDFKDVAHAVEKSGKLEQSRNIDRMLYQIAQRFAQLCHEEDWQRKMAGVAAIEVFVNQVELSRKLILELEIEYIRALLFTLRDAPKDAPKTSDAVLDLMKHIITTCQSPEDGHSKLQKLTETLVIELNSQSELSRKAAQACLSTLAETVGQTTPDLVAPAARAKLLDLTAGPIYSKPLRALPFPMQVGNIDAMTYLLELKPTFIETSEEFVRLLHEVLALADVEDSSLINKPATHKQETWLKTLRISCLSLLRSTVNQDFLNKPNLMAIRSRIIQVYFKHVYSQNPEIVDIAHEGLRDVTTAQTKLPKELLQSGLRPILVNLAEAKRLSVSGLDGLARFLELLTNYFKVEIGTKLLDHFDTLGDKQMLQKAAFSPLQENTDIARMTRLVKVFRLLPATAVQYLPVLTRKVVEVEAALHQSSAGPFTEDLAKYLDKYHVEGAKELFDNLTDLKFIRTYRNVIASGHAPQLTKTLLERGEEICTTCFQDFDNHDMVVPGLELIRELYRTSPGWLSGSEPVLGALVKCWRHVLKISRDSKADMTSVAYQQMSTLLLEMLMASLKHQSHIPLLFHVVEAFEIRASFERSQVAFFLYQQVALSESVEYRRDVIEQFFVLYEDSTVTWAFKTNGLRLIVNPTLRTYFAETNDESLISSALVQKLGQLMWRPLAITATAKQREDTLLIEIYALTTILVHRCPTKLSDNRKEIFKLAWMGINLLEPTVKLMAYVLTARFMVTFDTPQKFVRLTWTGLLRLKDNESRQLYRTAIDTLASCLLVRDPPMNGVTPEWAQRVRSVLVEEGHATGQLVTVCELLVNHPDLFYDYRELYVPHVANSLHKLAFVNASTPELKRLTVDIVELIYRWEKRRMSAKDEQMDVDEASTARRTRHSTPEPSPAKKQRLDRSGTAASSTSGSGWAAPSNVRELVTAHLLRLVSNSSDPVGKGGLTKRALDLFKEILGPKGLPNVNVKLGFFQRQMTQEINEKTIDIVANSTEVIAATAAVRDQQWVKTNLGLLMKLLEKVWVFDDTDLHETVKDLTESMFREMPDDDTAEGESEGKTLLAFVQNAVSEGLSSSTRASQNLPGTLFLLRTWLKAKPAQHIQADTVGAGLLKVLASLVKNHLAGIPDQAHRLIMSVLDIVRDRMSDFRDQRRHIFGVLGNLIDKSTNVTLCKYLLEFIRQWILEDPEPASLGKEKSVVLLKMAVFEHRDESLFYKYLELVYELYEVPELRATDMTHRLEPAFLLGTKSKNVVQRGKFLDKLEQTLPRALDNRLQYLYSNQNWDTLENDYWIPQILSLLMGAIDQSERLYRRQLAQVVDDDPMLKVAQEMTVGDLISAARNMIHFDFKLAHQLWVAIFPMCWASLSRQQQTTFTGYIVKLLAKDFHSKQIEVRPNVIQTFLDGVLPCVPVITLPPLLVKYLAKTYNAWYCGFEILTRLSDTFKPDDGLRDSCATALSELYAELSEDDMFYGLARHRCVFPETTAALTFEQNGMWPKAIEMYEQAQLRARNGLLPFSEEEYTFWEDHWILAAEKLQHWDSLTELARVDQDADLLLECAWRLSDWGSADREMIDANIARVLDVPTPRRKTFEAFTALLKAHIAKEAPNDFLRQVDEAQQVTLRKWVSLPSQITAAHLPLLQMFQQTVELQEAAQVFDSLSMTNQANLEVRVNQDLKTIFQTWRDRLPNFWDDIMVWSDLLAWRQHVFQAVTRVYVPLIPQNETSTYGYKGYHETAWMINRFGEVARRHGLLDVCSVALNKIYALPNIEISEAFLKLREQALCFFQKPDKFNDGLENISTTNLMYFAPAQKAEFLTLKGMFISKLGQNEEANSEFAHAIQMDMSLPKAWAEWGRFNDKLYRDRPETPPTDIPEPELGKPKMTMEQWALSYARDRALLASSAVSCYLQAAGLYNNHKSRGLLLRVLWLLGLDDANNTIAKAFENYKGDLVIWYWITLIPQLILSLSHREAKQARMLLLRIGKQFPQALFYHLRVAREDFGNVKRQHQKTQMIAAKRAADAARAAAANNADQSGQAAGAASAAVSNTEGADGAAKAENKEVKDESATAGTPTSAGAAPPGTAPPQLPIQQQQQAQAQAQAQGQAQAVQPPQPKQPWELVEDIMNSLKTAFPLLALTMEKMVDQISLRAKTSSDEDIYRFFAALLADALQQWGGRSGVPNDDGELNAMTKENLNKFSHNLSGDLKAAIEKDFIKDMPRLRESIRKLQWWRDTYERNLDARPKTQPLDQGGCSLIEFHHARFDDVEIPGQYVQHVDQSEEFIKIARFSPRAELGRGHGHCFRRITMIGSNGSHYTFNVQMPAARHCRREERLTQLFRIMNSVLKKRKESRRRNLQFHLPTAIPLAPQLRLVQNDQSYISLQDVFDDFCSSRGMSREDSLMAFYDRVKALYDPSMSRTDGRFVQLKSEVLEEIQTKLVPQTVLTNYMIRTMADPESLWLMRKQFAMQTAAVSFLTYVCCLSNRTPSRFHFSRKTGLMYMTEILPAFAPGQPVINSNESVPFRLTPNMQHFITMTGIEGVVSSAATAIARSLTMPEFDLAGTLSLFIRDEILTWHNTYMKDPGANMPLTKQVSTNVEFFIRRASLMGYIGEPKEKSSNAQLYHATVTLINQATSLPLLAGMPENFMAWY